MKNPGLSCIYPMPITLASLEWSQYFQAALGSIAAAPQWTGAVPLYRLRNDVGHFYTTNAAERDSAVATYGYVYEGIACYVLENTQQAGSFTSAMVSQAAALADAMVEEHKKRY